MSAVTDQAADSVPHVSTSSPERTPIDRDALLAKVTAYGVEPSYVDAFQVVRELPDSTLEWLAGEFAEAGPLRQPIIATPGRWHPELHGVVEFDDGRFLHVEGALPLDSVGYHRLRTPLGEERMVLCAPDRFRVPRRSFGWSVQLYDARTESSWGIGDFADLARIAEAAWETGAGFMLVCPLHAGNLGTHPMASPYSPTSREWLQVLYIAIDDVPGADLVDLTDLREQGLALNAERIIDRGAVWALKSAALQRIWTAIDREPGRAFRHWEAMQGEGLQVFATFMALADELGLPWQTWPAEYSNPDSPAVAAWAARPENAERIAFHRWMQWLADSQLGEAARQGVDLVADIAVGFDGGGADAWRWQDMLVFDAEVGCPPDRHNRDGQRWGLPAFNPAALVASDFAPFVAMVRSSLRHARAIRIDHVMQLWRLFWVPQAGSPAAGGYVRYPSDALLAILRIEADRAGAWVVGEDMGTVPDYVQPTMADIDMLGYRAACRVPISMFTVNTFGATGTHDHATIAGILTGQDPRDMVSVGKSIDPEAEDQRRRTLAAEAGLAYKDEYTDEEIAKAIVARCSSVANSASRVVVFNLEDAAAVRERPNMPGTIDQWPNWRIALPMPADRLLRTPLARSIAATARATRHI